MATIKFIRQAGQSATLQASLVPQRVLGNASGGVMSAGRFTTGPSTPTFSAGRMVKR
jgi:hypothetical protein